LAQAIDRLTERQKQCLRLVGQGYTSKQISPLLGISPATIDNHVRAALEILQVETRAEAARLVLANAPDQQLTSQPEWLADRVRDASTMAVSEPTRRWWRRLVPPLGGELHALNREGRIFAILRVAIAGFATLILLTLGTITLLWLLR